MIAPAPFTPPTQVSALAVSGLPSRKKKSVLDTLGLRRRKKLPPYVAHVAPGRDGVDVDVARNDNGFTLPPRDATNDGAVVYIATNACLGRVELHSNEDLTITLSSGPNAARATVTRDQLDDDDGRRDRRAAPRVREIAAPVCFSSDALTFGQVLVRLTTTHVAAESRRHVERAARWCDTGAPPPDAADLLRSLEDSCAKRPCTLACRHCLHFACFSQWAKSGKFTPRCPICRDPILAPQRKPGIF